ncbi:aliphatic sulfonate ABC transporter substrate-binding protein [Streptomyces sp. NPDC051956]|uniref:aliphatic sulfonate ABC transporter substrate-binding protein n=1 Tax=Streptomyces sp. NPDC051956 TaxID=3365677 RepID=UPI0037D85BA6
MPISRRAFMGALSAGVTSLTVSACSSGSGDGSKIVFGYIADYNGASLLAIADRQGLWKKQGLSVEYKPFTNGPVQIQALDTGNLDFGYIGPGAMWLPASGKSRIIAINTLTYADRVIAQAGISSIQGLKGKKVGVPEGTSGEMVLNLALQKAGMTMKDVKKVAMDPSTIVSAFSAGQIDGAGIFYPLIATIKEKVPDLVEIARTQDIRGGNFPTAFVAGNKVAQQTDRNVIQVLQAANGWRAAHPKESIAAAAKLLKVDEKKVAADAAHVKTMTTAELVAKTENGTVDTWLDGMSDFFVRTGQLKKAPDPSAFYLGDLYTKAYGK